MNEPIELNLDQPSKKIKRDQVLDDLDFSLDELNDEIEDENELNDTLESIQEFDFDESSELAYIPRACHNVQ